MITAKEAKQKLLSNPTFERKLELYKEVSDIIDTAVAEGRKNFHVTEEQHYALNKEILEKGYTRPEFQSFVVTGFAFGGLASAHVYAYNI